MNLYNTLSRKIEEFQPLNPPTVTMYSCGPTVYEKQHIGNYRSLLMYDFLARSLKYLKFDVKNVMNYTDVGHLTMTDLQKSEMEKNIKVEDTDAEVGVDKLEKQAEKEGLTPFQIADKYIDLCESDLKKLNFAFPSKISRATQYIEEQINLIKTLEEKGYTYKTEEAIYFDVEKYNQDTHSYFQLIGDQLNKQEVAVREKVVEDKTKKHPMDFRLWQLNQPHHAMQWNSPWGIGFPGWHIECSAMAMNLLGETIDLHAGGANLIFPHHTNEIAQSQAATGKQFVRYWVHGANLTVYGKKMGKSLGNAYTIEDVEKKGIDPLALRYLYLQTHYRQPMNFTWESAQAAQEAYNRLKDFTLTLKNQTERSILSEEKLAKLDAYRSRFRLAIENDLQLPQAVAVMWELIKSSIPSEDKIDLLYEFDQVLGLGLQNLEEEKIPDAILKLSQEINDARNKKDFAKSDQLRQQIQDKGYVVRDTPEGTIVKKR